MWRWIPKVFLTKRVSQIYFMSLFYKKLEETLLKLFFLSYSLFSILLTFWYEELTTAVFTVQFLVI